MKTDKEKLLAGELYDPNDSELVEARMLARERCQSLNQSSPRDESLRREFSKSYLQAEAIRFGLNRRFDAITGPTSISERRCTSTSIA